MCMLHCEDSKYSRPVRSTASNATGSQFLNPFSVEAYNPSHFKADDL